MRGSCVLSAGILVVIAGMTTKPLPTEHHPLDIAGMTALASLADERITRITLPIEPPSSKKPLKAIYPQPASYYLSQKPVQTLVNSSRTRRVKLREVSTNDYNSRRIQHLLVTIDQFLATLAPKGPQTKPESDTLAQDTSAQDSWTQAPYFQKYGYRYVMHEDFDELEVSEDKILPRAVPDFDELEVSEDEILPRAVPDFVSDPIDGTIGLADSEEEVTTTSEWFGLPDEATEKVTTNEEEKSSDPYEDDYDDYEARGNFYKDYAIEYEAYEEDEMPEGKLDSEETVEETDYYYESPILDEDTSPPAPSGSFDIYWETTDPNLL